MAGPRVVDVEVKTNIPRIRYDDGTVMVVRPLVPFGPGTCADDLDSLVFYQEGRLEAFVVNVPKQYFTPEDIGFRSKGKLTQQQVCEFWDAALAHLESEEGQKSQEGMIYSLLFVYGRGTKAELAEGKFKPFEKKDPFRDEMDF